MSVAIAIIYIQFVFVNCEKLSAYKINFGKIKQESVGKFSDSSWCYMSLRWPRDKKVTVHRVENYEELFGSD